MEPQPADTRVKGGNLLARWQRTLSVGADLRFRAYYDGTERTGDIIHEDRDTIDLDFQHRFVPADGHEIVWGLGDRLTWDDYINSSVSNVDPLHRTYHLYSAFFQDEISLFNDTVRFTLGSKFEHNDSSGFEVQPTARMLWMPGPRHKFWGALLKAVRTQSRSESDGAFYYTASRFFGIPYVINIVGHDGFKPEELLAYELGYRFLAHETLSLDAALFYNDYNNLRDFNIQTPVFTGTSVWQDYILANELEGGTYGVELALAWQPFEFLKCRLACAFMDVDLESGWMSGSPRHQVSLLGQVDLNEQVELDVRFRYVDDTDASSLLGSDGRYWVDGYVAMDLRLGWETGPCISLSLVGQNLLEGSHVELVQEAYGLPVEVSPSLHAELSLTF